MDSWEFGPPGVPLSAGRNRQALEGREHTVGNWNTEAESAAALDYALKSADLWNAYSEVPGTLVHPRVSQIDKSMRIDRVLVPNKRLLDLGWKHGIIGVEIKKSNIEVGPPIAQAMDYARSVWRLPGSGFAVWLDFVFIWPMGRPFGVTESVCQQQRIGQAFSTDWDLLCLKCGSANVLSVERRSSAVEIGQATPAGRGAGSR